jgi:hypothetical protein
MTATIELTPVSTERGHFSHEPSWSATAQSEIVYRATIYKRILLVIVLCVTIWCVAAPAQAQELFSPNLSPAATGIMSGRWLYETPPAATAPSLRVSMVDPQFRPSHSLHASTGGSRPTEPTIDPKVSLGSFGLAPEAQRASSGSFAYDDSIRQESFLSFVQTKYLLRESSLANPQSLTSVNAISTQPLLQINYAGWNLPVTLFNPPSRASEVR